MPHFDRGVYEPNDELRVFDGAEDDDDVEGSRLPLLIVLALLVLAMFAGVVWLAYTQGVARGRTETPVLTAQNGPARIAPQNPGGAEQPYKGFKIYEQPAPPDDAVDSSTPVTTAAAPAAAPVAVTPPAPKPAPVAAAVPKPAPPVGVAKVAAPVVPAAKIAPAPVAKVVPPPVAAAKVAAPPAPVKVAAAAPAPVVAAAALAPAKPVPAAAGALATRAPRSLALAPKPGATPAPTAPAAAGGTYVLQIGAYKSQAEAATAWQTYKAKHAALLAGTSDDIQQADLADKGVWYRLRITGFPSKDVASALCDRLKADGGGCFLGK